MTWAEQHLSPEKQKAWKYVGGLSAPNKMPGFAYNIPASLCKTGSKLRKQQGTTCSGCYAFTGFYNMGKVAKAAKRRYRSLTKPKWVKMMITLIKDEKWFRWHDTGDIQGMWHLENILSVVEQTPNVRHWLPTLEWHLITKLYHQKGQVPLNKLYPNLKIVLSSMFVDQPPPIELALKLGVGCSGVSSNTFTCPAKLQAITIKKRGFMTKDGKAASCGPCRMCWDQGVLAVIYPYHSGYRHGPVKKA